MRTAKRVDFSFPPATWIIFPTPAAERLLRPRPSTSNEKAVNSTRSILLTVGSCDLPSLGQEGGSIAAPAVKSCPTFCNTLQYETTDAGRWLCPASGELDSV